MSVKSRSGSSVSRNVSVDGADVTLAEEIQGVDESELIRINIDVEAAVTMALGVLPKVAEMRKRINALPELDQKLIDKLELYALALYDTNADWLAATQPPASLPQLAEEGTAVRDVMYADVQALIARGLIDAQEIREVRTDTGYKALARDLKLLTDALQRNWEAVLPKTGVDEAEVLHAQQLSRSLLRALGERDQAPAVTAAAAATRARAFVLFTRSYDELRRAVMYLRYHEGDADLLAPSLYSGRNNHPPKKKPEPTAPPTTTTPAGTTPSTAPSASGTAAPDPTPTTPALPPVEPVGFSNSHPFTHA